MRLSHIITAIAAAITLASTTPASAQSIRQTPKTLLSSRLGHAELKCSTTSTGTELFFLVLPTGNTYKPAIVVHLGDSIKATQIFTLLTSELENGTWVDFEDERGTRVLSNYRGKTLLFYSYEDNRIPGNSSRREMQAFFDAFLEHIGPADEAAVQESAPGE